MSAAPRPLPAAPGQTAGLTRLADTAREMMRLDEAVRLYREVLRRDPGNLDAEIGLMRCAFYAEDWPAAWAAFDVRFRRMEKPPAVFRRNAESRPVPMPRWSGGPVPKSLLVLDEQGMGDTIQFLRFLLPVVAAGCRVTLVTHRRLFGLIGTMGLDIALRPMDEAGSIAGIEAWSPLLSLPGALSADAGAIAMREAYLKADPARICHWKQWLGEGGPSLGICWQGNPEAPVDAGRSAPLAALAPLAAIPGVRLVSLQRGAGSEQCAAAGFGNRITVPEADFDAGPDAFLDTAALMASLDLVVSVDTAVVHLAGALGRPAAVALRARDADWRWVPGRATTPWYPSAKLYRQPEQGDWWGAFARIAEDIRNRRPVPATAPAPLAPISVGELLDKITILEIKAERIGDVAKLANIRRELDALKAMGRELVLDDARFAGLSAALKRVNESLWTIEDDIRECEHQHDFGDKFISLARAVYQTNDRRAALKSEINVLSGSMLREEKSYV